MTELIVKEKEIKDMIYEIRGKQVMLDSDLAKLFKTTTKAINQSVIRNIKKFPEEFSFKLSEQEKKNFWSQFVTKNQNYETRGGKYRDPRVFTEQGIIMLSSILKSDTAIEVSVKIVEIFVEMRKFINNNAHIFNRLTKVEYKLLENDEKFDILFDKLENKTELKEKLFFDGQIYEAYSLLINIIRKAMQKIIIIDNYIDKEILDILIYKNENVKVEIWTKNIKSDLDIKKFHLQYENVIIKKVNNFHDRFIIIDDEELYHIGASLKDLGKKCFAINKMNKTYIETIKKER